MHAMLRLVLILSLTSPFTVAFYVSTPITLSSHSPMLRQAKSVSWRMDTKIPDFFPSDWGRRGGLGLGEGGIRIPDSFNGDAMEKEKQGGRTAVLERPPQRTDPGKKYKVLLFNDEKNTKEFVIQTLVKFIPGMTAEKAKQVTLEAHQTGIGLVGIWMLELAEAYSDVLRSQGLRSDIAEE